MKKNELNHLTLGLSLTIGVGALSYLYKKNKRNNLLDLAIEGTENNFTSQAAEETHHHYLVGGDIGGTNSRLALYSVDPSVVEPLHFKYYSNEKYLHAENTNFEDSILVPFLKECFAHSCMSTKGSTVENCSVTMCLAAAGPVRENAVEMTNIEHGVVLIDGTGMERNETNPYLACLHRVKVVNDFVGMGYGALDLDLDEEVIELTPNSKHIINPTGPKVCVGAGTGLGECYLTVSSLNTEQGYECYPSEGGHVCFSPRGQVEIELLQYLMDKFQSASRISVERVVSGKGIANVYEFLSQRFPDRVDPEVHAKIEQEGDQKGRVISQNSMRDGESLCRETMNIFASAYGAEVGGAAIKFIPTGGLYVVGGLTPKNIKYIEGDDSPFMKAYRDKGRVSPVLDTIPLFAVKNEDLGLRGARVCAMREYKARKNMTGS